MSGGGRGAAVTAVIVAVDRHTGCHQNVDRADVPPDMFTHTMYNLDHAAHGTTAIPPGARDAQSVCAGQSKLSRIFPPLFSDICFQINWLSCSRRYGVGM